MTSSSLPLLKSSPINIFHRGTKYISMWAIDIFESIKLKETVYEFYETFIKFALSMNVNYFNNSFEV